MRIVAGKHRSRRLIAPAGLALRPTAARAREALFSILAHGRIGGRDIPALDGASVLDVFAGTGAFGLEAISRGAEAATFIDRDPVAVTTVKRNVVALKESARATVLRLDAAKPGKAPRAHDIAFLDPPYGKGLAASALAALDAGGWLGPDPLVAVEVGAEEAFPPPKGFHVLDERRYGAAKFVFLGRALGVRERAALLPEVEPDEDEIAAIDEGRRR